ncbi:MAG: cyclic nucleotide-binding domain-containing protein [Actinomycetota bacterium]|nr:cyclic nucleotide-binding domain-containing protein [Actinomycetota bacterium]
MAVSHSLVKALKRVPGFALLEEEDLLEILGASVNLVWSAGDCVFSKGTPGEALYIVLTGRVQIYDEVNDTDIEIAQIAPGDYFGEHSLLCETTHTKNVKALEDVELLVLAKESFNALLAWKPDLDAQIRETLEARLSQQREKYDITTAS